MRWDDPVFQIAWREKVEVVSDRDRAYPDLELLGRPPEASNADGPN
jgi:hypothetical protein